MTGYTGIFGEHVTALQGFGQATGLIVPSSGGPLETVDEWWAEQSTGTKVAIMGGAVAVVGWLGYLLFWAAAKKKAYAPNKRSSRRRRAAKCAALKSVKTCRCKKPKKYRSVKKSQFALPECFMYPLDTKKHVRTAAGRFGKFKRRYPKTVQRKIAKRLDAAKRRFHVGQYR